MFGFKNEEERLKAVESIIKDEWEMFQKVNNIGEGHPVRMTLKPFI
ncbi:hypothetical protein [Aminipila terrae]|uniref:Uncharacterized protein n=1 Tax=Aminipila terrae TaxID=2697030 RepID=A0A6P1MF44_9FIRM|nr:hypothetical protein [Aminipila terrae]QHI73339.1 hypothetical protein Ami3637_13995 [Aminipila terrae]